jgi:hypothetical protein
MSIWDWFIRQSANKIVQAPTIDRQKFQERWQKIESMLRVRTESSMKQALLEADKLLDLGLKEKRVKGETMGERLKSAVNLFDKNLYNEIWSAHKLRNQLVHEDSEILSFQIENKVLVFKRALKAINIL